MSMSCCDPARGRALIEDARVELVSSYDTSDFPFQEMFRQMFQIQDETELCNLHKMTLPEKAPLSLALMHGFTVAGHKCPKSWNKARLRKKDRLKKFIASRAFQNFQNVFIRFVETVVVPLIGDPSGVVYQNPPTFRVQLPSNSPIGIPHKDADYDCHVDTEINIWVPVTDVSSQILRGGHCTRTESNLDTHRRCGAATPFTSRASQGSATSTPSSCAAVSCADSGETSVITTP